MAAGLSGMFGNQGPVPPPPPPPPPPVAPGGPGPAGLLAPTPAGQRNPSNTLVDELEASFEACFASLVSQDYVNGTDQEEIRTGVDQCIQKFLDVARQTECFFLQKRLQLSVQKPEQRHLSDMKSVIFSTLGKVLSIVSCILASCLLLVLFSGVLYMLYVALPKHVLF
uniref:Mediator of RNA polymerase II transcription subunit 28 n=1 Tax=Pogona vitticeps TaxID=103695 RepID=A0ABM5GHT8_9SAUR